MPRADDLPLVAVLAAGLASRFGGGKLDADCGGKPLGQWALDATAAAGLPAGVIVVGPQSPSFAKAVAGWKLLTNPAPEQGLGVSVSLVCREAQAQSRPILLVLADMPLVSPDHLKRLCLAPASAATLYPGNRAGVPAFIAPDDVGKFTQLRGDSGAGRLLSGLDGLTLHEASTGTLLDVDDAQSLEAAKQSLAAR